jgi:pimeloyl-ACP methyl ester carboxylesterase
VSAPRERSALVNGCACRIWEAGSGAPLVYLGGPLGVPHWTPFLARLAQERRVIVPSLPGFPGATGHDRLDSLLDWIAATLDLLDATGVERFDLVGASLGGALAAEVAGAARSLVERLVLIAPLGICAEEEPVADLWARRPGEPSLLTADPAAHAALVACPPSLAADEWSIVHARANDAAARLLWPCAELGSARRLHRIQAPALILWGAQDRVAPPSYAKRFAAHLRGPVRTLEIEGAGHLADLDRPERCAGAVREFLGVA